MSESRLFNVDKNGLHLLRDLSNLDFNCFVLPVLEDLFVEAHDLRAAKRAELPIPFPLAAAL